MKWDMGEYLVTSGVKATRLTEVAVGGLAERSTSALEYYPSETVGLDRSFKEQQRYRERLVEARTR